MEGAKAGRRRTAGAAAISSTGRVLSHDEIGHQSTAHRPTLDLACIVLKWSLPWPVGRWMQRRLARYIGPFTF